MEEKLELRHLAYYLPYGLKAQLSQQGRFNLDSEYTNEHQHKIGTIINWGSYDGDLNGILKVEENYSFDFDELAEIDILLRPLSQLTEEIEHNGKRFVPSHKLYREHDISAYSDGNLFFNGDAINPLHGYEVIRQLLEWHFDVFRLLDKGLALPLHNKV